MKLLVLDNYDSFTYNLLQLIEECGIREYEVLQNDQIDCSRLPQYASLLISPGPGIPAEAGQLPIVLRSLLPSQRVLGICLGHQAIAEHFGARLQHYSRVFHGVTCSVDILDPTEYLFQGVPNHFDAGLYHSWGVSSEQLPEALNVTARSSEGIIMALTHTSRDVKGVQFHPESIMTPFGKLILQNWLHHPSRTSI